VDEKCAGTVREQMLKKDPAPLGISLHEEMDHIIPQNIYPTGVVPVPRERIAGTAFFPGGPGLYFELSGARESNFPFHEIMVLGHNFDSELRFKRSRCRGKEDLTRGTWRGLLRLFKGADISPDQCFYTHGYAGLCGGDDNRRYLGREDEQFRAACVSFLRFQIHFQQPRLILTLGLHVPPLLAELSSDLADWNRPRLRITDLDAAPLFLGVKLNLSSGLEHATNVVALVHPSRPNNARRMPKGFAQGEIGEIEMIRAGLRGRI
jgi:hypothetical protein